MEAPVIKSYAQYTTGTQLYSPNYQIEFQAQVIGYIDDNNTTKVYQQLVPTQIMQKDTETEMTGWANLLRATGGSLSKEKKCDIHDRMGNTEK